MSKILDVRRDCPALSIVTSARNDGFGARDFVGRLRSLLASLDRAATTMPRRSLEVVVVDCARAPLGDHAFVRADRYDFRAQDVAGAPSQWTEPRPFVAMVRHGASPLDHIVVPVHAAAPQTRWPRSRRLRGELGSSVIWGPRGGLPSHFLRGAHTHQNGDLVCVSKAAWRAVGGLTEDPNIWLHGDSLFVAQLLGAKLRQVIYAKPGALLHEDHPRATDEEKGEGVATWPVWLQWIQEIIDGRVPSRLNPRTFGLENEDLAVYTIT